MVLEASGVNGKQASSGGYFLISDNEGLQRSGIRTKRSIDIPLRKPVTKKKGAGGAKRVQGVKRGNGFSRGETESLLELLHEHISLAKDEWEKVCRLHELRYPQQRRNADSTRRKFSALCRTVPPTGDPTVPTDVLKAKEVRKAMTERADIGEGDESECEYTNELQTNPVAVPRTGAPANNGSSDSVVPEIGASIGDYTTNNAIPDTQAQTANPSPRPLVRKRPVKSMDDDDIIVSAVKASMLQEQMRREDEYRQRKQDREDEKQRREQERSMREQESLEDRERRIEERQRSEKMTQMIMVALLGSGASELFNRGGTSDPR